MRKDTNDYADKVAEEYVFYYKRDFGHIPPSNAVSSIADAAKAIMKGRRFGPDFLTKKALEKSMKEYIKAVDYEPLKIGEGISCLVYYCMATEVGGTVTDPACYWADEVCMRVVGPYISSIF